MCLCDLYDSPELMEQLKMNTLNIDSKERRLLGCAHKSRRFVRSTVNGKQLHIVLACNHCHKQFETVHTIGAAQASPV